MNKNTFRQTLKGLFALMAFWLAGTQVMAQSVTFTAATYNVDGLPSIANSDGPGSNGTKKISQKLAEKAWDIIGVQEDFDNHTELVSSIKNNYYIGTFRGSVSLSQVGGSVADTDGLEFFTKNSSCSTTGETFVEWDTHIGDLQNGADGLIKKGFRYYCVTFTNGRSVDVYVLHMNSESTQVAIDAKHDEIRQLVAYIKNHNNGRPIIVMGDTNCRYTREELKLRFIDEINADPDYFIQDAWIEFERMGFYPAVGSPTVDGEVVDKLFYINNRQSGVKLTANSFLHDPSFVDGEKQLSDHKPIVVNFTIDPYTYDMSKPIGPEEQVAGELDGTYYLRNVGTGKYLSQGLIWGTQAVVDEVGFKVKLTALNGGYQIKTPCGYIEHWALYIDKSELEHQTHAWYFRKAPGKDYYTFGPEFGSYVGVSNLDNGYVNQSAFPNEPLLYAWELVTPAEREAELAQASLITPINASFLIPGAQMHRANPDGNWTESNKGKGFSAWAGEGASGDEQNPGNSFLKIYNGAKPSGFNGYGWGSAGTLTQTVSGLRAGKYKFSWHAFTTTTSNMKIKVNGTQYDIAAAPSSLGTNISGVAAATELAKDTYKKEIELTLNANATLTIQLVKQSNSSETSSCFDDFQLIYLGPASQSIASLLNVFDEMKSEANELLNSKMENSKKSALQTAINATPSTQQQIIDAASALRTAMDEAKTSIAQYRIYKTAIDHMYELMASTNVYTQAAYNTYKGRADNFLTKYNAGTLNETVCDPFINNGWRNAETDCAPFLYSAFGTHAYRDGELYVNVWSVESASDGSNFGLPFFEYWYAKEGGQCLPARTYTGTKTGLKPNQTYIVTSFVRVATLNAAATPSGITMQVSNGTAVDVTNGKKVTTNFDNNHFYLGTYSTTGKTDANGTLTITFNVANGTTIHWLAFKNLMVTEPLTGDVNNDTKVSLSDVPAFIELELNGNPGYYNEINANSLNGNNAKAKVETLVNKIITK